MQKIGLLYPYRTLRTMSFSEILGLQNQPCFMQRSSKDSQKFTALTFFENEFYAGNKIKITDKIKASLVPKPLQDFLKENPSFFLFGLMEEGEENFNNYTAFEYFCRNSRKIGFNKLNDTSFVVAAKFTERFSAELLKTQSFNYIKFPLQELSFKNDL